MLTSDIETRLSARYISDVASGHRGARIMRLADSSGQGFIAKCVDVLDHDAIEDLESNLYGYEEMRRIGARDLVPRRLRRIDIEGFAVLAMEDLGSSVAAQKGGERVFRLFLSHALRSIEHTTAATVGSDWIGEVLAKLREFAPDSTLDEVARTARPHRVASQGAIMLLDFTPDNVFVTDEKMTFIDPWRQASYLGNPAVSIGQFATLSEIYGLDGAGPASETFLATLVRYLESRLGSSEAETRYAWRLGTTLQYALSSYVRKESDPARAKEMINRANRLWSPA